MGYYLGIDGGGTKTKVCIMNERHQDIAYGVSGPSSIDTVSKDITKQHFEDALHDALSHLDFKPIFDGVFAGVGGIRNQNDIDMVVGLLKHIDDLSNAHINAANDTENALASGMCFDEGMALILGTGMICLGKDTKGRRHVCGGWGYKEGDAGSAFDLGYQAVKSLVRAKDGRIHWTSFHEDISNHLQALKTDEIVSALDVLYEDRTKMAALAPIVTKHANLGNSYALRICDVATDEIYEVVRTVYSKLALRKKTLVVIGGLGHADGYFKHILHEKIKKLGPIDIIGPSIDPAHGAAYLAKRIK